MKLSDFEEFCRSRDGAVLRSVALTPASACELATEVLATGSPVHVEMPEGEPTVVGARVDALVHPVTKEMVRVVVWDGPVDMADVLVPMT